MPPESKRRPSDEVAPENQSIAGQLVDEQILGDSTPKLNYARPDFEGIPAELRAIDNWVAWSLDPPRGKSPKPTKTPINPKTGGPAKVNDPGTWSSFEKAVHCCTSNGLAGVGLVLTPEHGLFVVDLDNCIDPETGEIDPAASQLVERFASYTETSPSNTGLHIWARGQLPPGHNRKGNFEVYASGRYMTVTGRPFDERFMAIEERTGIMAEVFAEVFVEPPKSTPKQQPRDAAPDLDDAALLEKARKAKNSDKFERLYGGDHSDYESQSEAELALCGLLAFWCGGDPARINSMFRGSGLMRDKWDERHGETTYGQRTIAKALAGRTEFYRPTKAKASALEAMPEWTDSSNAELFVELSNGDLRYCAVMKAWFKWNSRVWEHDSLGAALRQGKAVIRELKKRAQKINDSRRQAIALAWVRKCATAERRKAMPTLAAAEHSCAIRADVFDNDSWLLNLQNGTLDLRTMKLRPQRREDFITKVSPAKFDPVAKAPHWLRFLETIIPDEEERNFLQRFAGLCLTGDQGDQVLLFLLGDGANGKSTALRILQAVMGYAYAINASSELLTKKRDRGHPTEYADLAGVRLAICAEMNQGDPLDESLVKRLTGGERVRARRMKQDFWEFDPTHHIVIATNHLPSVRGREHAIWRRLLVLRFRVTIGPEAQDRGLADRILCEERDGVLQWALEGLADWKARGNKLEPPESVLAESNWYRRETDYVARFVNEACERHPNSRTGATDLYRDFLAWCDAEGVEPESQRSFGMRLKALGEKQVKSGGVVQYREIRPIGLLGPENGVEGGSGMSSRLSSHESSHSYGGEPDAGPQSSPSGGAGDCDPLNSGAALASNGPSKSARDHSTRSGSNGSRPRGGVAGPDDIDDHGHPGWARPDGIAPDSEDRPLQSFRDPPHGTRPPVAPSTPDGEAHDA